MKHGKLFVLAVTVASVFNHLQAAQASTPVPPWMTTDMDGFEAPSSLSGAEQDQCTQVILEQINRRTRLSLTSDDVTPVKMPSWTQAEAGFVRGGGFNVHIVTTLAEHTNQIHRFHAGRFTDVMGWLRMGDEPSLHLPKNIDGQQTFFEDEDASGTHLDFIAHVDSSYAFLPLGLFRHLFTDVIGADSRNPCPVEGGESRDQD